MAEWIPVSASMGQEGPSVMLPPSVSPMTAPVAAPVKEPSAWDKLLNVVGQGAQIYSSTIKAKPPKVPIYAPPRGGSYAPPSGGSYAPLQAGLPIGTIVIIGGSVVAALAIAYFLMRK